MFKACPLLESTSVCLRCQYRITTGQQRLSRLPSPFRDIKQSRKLSHSQRQTQEQLQHDDSGPGTDYLASIPRRKTSSQEHKPDLRYAHRQVKLHRKDALGVDSLGRPAEVLILNTPEVEPDNVLRINKSDYRETESALGSANEMLEKIKAEQGIPSERGIAENLEELRDTWVSNRKRKEKPLTPGENEDLVGRLDAGFTVKQLVGYYMQAGSKTAVDPFDLDQPYSTDTYTRSAWKSGTTAFPGDASTRLKISMSAANDFGHTEVGIGFDSERVLIPIVKAHTPKRVVIERILWECWHLRSIKEEEALGELEIWIQPEHNHLLLNHGK